MPLILSSNAFHINKNAAFVKTNLNISDDQTNIDKYRLAAHIIEYHIISTIILQQIIITNFCGSESNFNLKSKFETLKL